MDKKDLVLSELIKVLVSEFTLLREAYEKEPLEGIQFRPVNEVIKEIYQVMEMTDPEGTIFESEELTNGLKIAKMYIPKGFLGLIYDGDPLQVLSIAARAIKSSNFLVVLANPKTEKICKLIVKFIKLALEAREMSIDMVRMEYAEHLEDFSQHEELDLILVSGSVGLWKDFQKIKLKKHNDVKKGLSHFYVDELVDVKRAVEVILDSICEEGTKYPISTVLVHDNIAQQLLPELFTQLDQKKFLLHLDTKCWNFFNARYLGKNEALLATDADWLDSKQKKEMNVKIVDSFEEGIIHILQHGNKKYEGILSDNPLNGMIFSSTIDAEQILINASSKYCRESIEGKKSVIKVDPSIKLEELMGSKILIQGHYFTEQ